MFLTILGGISGILLHNYIFYMEPAAGGNFFYDFRGYFRYFTGGLGAEPPGKNRDFRGVFVGFILEKYRLGLRQK